MRKNTKAKDTLVFTHEGAVAVSHEKPIDVLKRTTMCCMLWEDSFYEDGESIAKRIADLVPKCSGEDLLSLVTDIRNYGIRHAPLLIIKEMMKYPHTNPFVEQSIEIVCDRPDQLTELLQLYWLDRAKNSPKKIAYSFIKGAKRCFKKWNAYTLAKYKQEDKSIKLRDVLRLVHPKPVDEEQSVAFKELSKGTLKRFDTWEDRLSSGEDKKTVWTELLQENKLGGLAILRNLRNMSEQKVDKELIRSRIAEMNISRIEPFRLMKAIEYGESFAPQLEEKVFEACKRIPKIKGHTLVLLDTSGSMSDKISSKSELTRAEAAFGLAVILREVCEEATIFEFHKTSRKLPYARGFALWNMGKHPSGGTNLRESLNSAWEEVKKQGVETSNVIIVTDEQSSTTAEKSISVFGGKGLFINVASYRPSIAHKDWENMTGWSEKVVDYIARKWNYENS